jgi:hypothetical protein
MTTQLERLKIHLEITDSSEDALLRDILTSAKNAILARRYPYTEYPMDETGETILEKRYEDLQIRIAVYLYNKRGAEGQTSHSENGINRTYESADVPESLMRGITPYVGVFK